MSGKERGRKRPPSQVVPSVRRHFRSSDLPWFLQSQAERRRALAPLLADPETARRLAEADALAREGGLADVDPYAEIADADVPSWGSDERDLDQRLASYSMQLSSNPGQFAINFDEQVRGRDTKKVVKIFQLNQHFGCPTVREPTDTNIRKFYNNNGVKNIRILQSGKRYTFQPLSWDGGHLSLVEDGEHEFTVPPGYKWVAVPITIVEDFIKYTDMPQRNLIEYNYEGKNLFLIKRDQYSQKYYDPYTSMKAYGIF